MSASASAICGLGKSGARFIDRDLLLNGFVGHDDFTAKEVALEVLGWGRDGNHLSKFAACQQRVGENVADAYLVVSGHRVCRHSKKSAMTYRVTDEGLDRLRRQGFKLVKPVVAEVVAVKLVDGRSALAGIRNMLGQGG
jgi:hypothetical protein